MPDDKGGAGEPAKAEDRDVSLRFKIDTTGLEVGAHSRLISAADRLLGDLVDWPGSLVRGLNARRQITEDGKTAALAAETKARQISNDARLAVLEAQARAVVSQATRELAQADVADLSRVIDRQQAQLLLSNFVNDQGRRLENKRAITAEAVALLEDQRGRETPAYQAKAEAAPEGEPEPLSDDWLNLFADHAERATSEAMRSRWARILAGEVQKPGSFSLSTLRAVAELDAKIARLFQTAAVERAVDGYIARPGNLEGTPLGELLALEEAGLISNVGMSLSRYFMSLPDGHILIQRGQVLLVAQAEPNTRVPVFMSPLTRVGREIASILPQGDDATALTLLAEEMKGKVEQIDLAFIVPTDTPGSITWRPIRQLWKRLA